MTFPYSGSSSADNASTAQVHYRYQQAGKVNVFYREAGDPASPVLLMLHGFAGSSFMFRDLIAQLADRYRLIAPDYRPLVLPRRQRAATTRIPLTSWLKPLTSSLKRSASTPML